MTRRENGSAPGAGVHEGPRSNYLMHLLGQTAATLTGWRVTGQLPDARRMVVLGAPHTSNWDFLIMLMGVSSFRVKACWLGKHTLFTPPLGYLMRALGGLPIDRGATNDVVRQLGARMRAEERFALVIAPEGTRRFTDHWRSGFYAIALEAQIPVVCGFVDYPTRVVGMGPSFVPSGDRRADMELCRAFYHDKRGRYPELAGEVRLLDEG